MACVLLIRASGHGVIECWCASHDGQSPKVASMAAGQVQGQGRPRNAATANEMTRRILLAFLQATNRNAGASTLYFLSIELAISS
jgi:hypothetical protein